MELHKLTIHEARDLLRKKEVSANELTQAAIDQINKTEKDIKAFITTDFDNALAQADMVDNALSQGGSLPDLAGIPMGLKDNICTKGVRTTCASKMLESFVPPYSATAYQKLLDNKGILIGKLNMDEFAIGSSSKNSAFFTTHNPWDLDRVPGGSSGGSAAAVAADQVFYSLGSDTGGSIRQPASYCGVVGLKPTYGAVSRYGSVAFASSLDQLGPLTKDVTDCAIVMNAIAGHDNMDSTSVNVKHPDYTKFLQDNVAGLKIAVPKEYFDENIDNDVREAIKRAVKMYEEMGAIVEEVSLPHTKYALSTYIIISSAEGSSNLGRYDGIRFGYRPEEYDDLSDLYFKSRTNGFGTDVKRRIMLGNFTLNSGKYDEYFLKALKVRTLIREDFDAVFDKFDIVLSPTSPTTAFKFDEIFTDPARMYQLDLFTVQANLSGLPALSIPCGFDSNGLPIGMQLIGKPFDEGALLGAAYTFEQNTDYHIKRPALNWR